MLFESVGGWRGRLLFQACILPSDILHSSFKIFNHEVKGPSQVQRTLARICFGISFPEKNKRNNTLKENEFPTPTVHHVEFRYHFHHCHHWTMNLGSQIMIQNSCPVASYRSVHPALRCGKLLSDDCAVLSRHVSCRL